MFNIQKKACHDTGDRWQGANESSLRDFNVDEGRMIW